MSHTTAHATAEQKPILQRLGWRQRMKKFLHPDLRKERVQEEVVLSQRIEPHLEGSVELPSLPGAGLQKLREREKPMPVSPIQEDFDADLTQGGDDVEITALPPLPGYRYQASDGPQVFQERIYEPSIKYLADQAGQAMEEAMAVADVPGNRSSTRLPLTAIWTAEELESPMTVGNGGIEQQAQRIQTGQREPIPLPAAVFLPGATPLPCFQVLGNKPATARSEADDIDNGEQKTSAPEQMVQG